MGLELASPRTVTVRTFTNCLLFATGLLSTAGCALLLPQSRWSPPAPYSAALITSGDTCADIATAYYHAGQRAELDNDPRCVDFYLAAAMAAWPRHVSTREITECDDSMLYHSSVQALIESANRSGRFNRNVGIVLSSGQVIPVAYHGFNWAPSDFCNLLPVGTYESPRLSRRHAACGVGVPYVVLTATSPKRPFTNSAQPFAATAVVSPSLAAGGGPALEFFDPLRTDRTLDGLPLARDLTAPIAYAVSQETDAWLDDFVRPGRGDTLAGLHMHEPFQPGKIPVVFVHGLASDPLTWSELENELTATPEIHQRYQFWFFRYDTGDPFLSSASTLREQLVEVRRAYDPQRSDGSLSQMVLVGHSMGGLVSKMQVTYSGDVIWRAAATRPLETVVADPDTRARLAAAFFFTPSPDIKRVIYIATPHRGAAAAQRLIGRISSALIEVPADRQLRYDQVALANPGLFREELRDRIPTSIDLLEPNSEILQATQVLPYGSDIQVHSVIGDNEVSLRDGPSDGVVPVSSAYLSGVRSNLVVEAEHTQVQRHPNTVREIICILTQHAATNVR